MDVTSPTPDVDTDTHTGQAAESRSMQYLTFDLAGESYGVDILRVVEIRGLEGTTRIPNASSYVRGVVNLRGAIVPVIDLRNRFDLPAVDYGPATVVIVLRSNNSRGSRIMGVVVDAVSDVLDSYDVTVGATPEFGARVNTDFISGVAATDTGMIMLLDVDKLLNHADITDAIDEEVVAPTGV